MHEEDYDENRVQEALRISKLDTIVNQLPKGIHSYINTDLSPDGINFSGGQQPVSYTHLDVYKRQASYTMRAASDEHFCAFGWNAKMIGFLVFNASKLLKLSLIHI